MSLSHHIRPSAGRTLVAAALLLPLFGCVHARVTGFDPSAAADQRTPADRIRFYEIRQPTCPYKEIGHVALNPYWFTPWSRVVRKARDKAHELGGDAIVSLNESTRISGAVISKDGVSTTETTTLSGTVVRFTDAACRE